MRRPADDRPDDEERGLALLHEASDAIVLGVERELPGWVERSVRRILDAWGRTPADARARAERDAVDAGRAATDRIVNELRALFARDVEEQRSTPLEIVRHAYREPTAVLAAVGVAPVERDDFAERAWPDDTYGLVVHGLGDLGDEDLAPLQMAWGLAKAKVVRARRDR
ncbi:MAG TPA: hypothetical protein VK549_01165 [Acidimicrobiia bacterium]|nr:hypothetical protein [Acidimicrobiia bacterium]